MQAISYQLFYSHVALPWLSSHSRRMRRRAYVVGSFATAVFLAGMAALFFVRPAVPMVSSFASCVQDGGTLSADGVFCLDGNGGEFHRDDRVAFSDPSVPFSFSYPGRLSLKVTRHTYVFSGSGELLTLTLFSQTEADRDVLQGRLTGSGSYSVIRSVADAKHDVLLALPRGHSGKAVLLLPLRPPMMHRGFLVDFAELAGSDQLVRQALNSLAFSKEEQKHQEVF